MEDFSKKRLYKKIIVKLLREKKLSIDELLTDLNDILKNDYGFEPISRRTFPIINKNKTYYFLKWFTHPIKITVDKIRKAPT